ncbi:hypothetical protein C7S13_0071 [Burkholderia cepacia]|nr:hypothetical protein [Burkholderia cepacia]MDW9243026.1 hypothetical protein [Burkholderia cepacia]
MRILRQPDGVSAGRGRAPPASAPESAAAGLRGRPGRPAARCLHARCGRWRAGPCPAARQACWSRPPR